MTVRSRGRWLFIVTGCIAVALAGDVWSEITRYPYLQPTLPSDTSVGLVWRTANPAAGTVRYGVEGGAQQTLSTSTLATRHVVVLKGLSPGMAYTYQVVSDGTTTPVYRFRTSPPDGRFKVLLLSDMHIHAAGDEKADNWRQRWDLLYPRMLDYDPDLVLICGDLTQRSTPAQWDAFFDATRNLLATAIVVPAPGNHDRGPKTEAYANYLAQWHLPDNGPAGRKGLNYSYDYGQCHFLMVLDVNESVKGWLDQDLAAAAKARFVFGTRHWPVYVDTRWDFENHLIEWKQILIDAFDRHRMDIWFQGHRHAMQRSRPIVKNPYDPAKWGLIDSPDSARYTALTRGTIYMQLRSCWYGKTGGVGLGQYFAVEPDDNNVGFATMDVAGDVCTVRSYRCSPKEGDWVQEDAFVIDRSDRAQPAKPRFVRAPAVSTVEAYRARITCATDAPAKLLIEWGPAPGRYPYTTPTNDVAQNYATDHTVWLQALTPGTRYYFRARAIRGAGETLAEEGSFMTGRAVDGQVVAQFNFQPMQYVPPPQYVAATDWPYTAATRCGWVDGPVDAWREVGRGEDMPIATSCIVPNSTQRRWRADMPDGAYSVEIVSGNGGEHYGQTYISIEDGQTIIAAAAPKPDAQAACRRWRQEVVVSDGMLDFELGKGDPSVPACTVINALIVRSRLSSPTTAPAQPTATR